MSICLGLLFHQADYPFLRLHIPYLAPAFGAGVDIVAASDDVNSEAAQFLRSVGAHVAQIEWTDDWSAALNQLMGVAATLKYQKMVRADPDELLFVEDVPKIDAALDTYSLMIFTRINHWYDRAHYDVGCGSDFQYRAWRLDGSCQYVSKRHEGIFYTGDPAGRVVVTDVVWHHYGDASRTGYMRKALKYENYRRIDEGLPPVDKLPDDVHPGANVELFTGAQPIPPETCGLTAPFSE